MTLDVSFDRIPAPLRDAMLERGFESLTPVQRAVLDPELEGRDLRISSQTGSGKTVAIGLVLAGLVARHAEAPGGGPREGGPRERACRPRAIVVAPTRELAAQVSNELAWLLAPLGARALTVTGGTNVGLELRALARGAEIVVGTPGRLLDHLSRGAVDASEVRAVVLDEADQLLDLGFRDELEAIVEALPQERQTLLVSATFPRDVLALAERYQHDPAAVAGTPPGDANADIAHVAHLVRPDDRFDALVNLLLVAPPDERTLVFTRTRAGAAELAERLADERFAAAGLTGEMEQRERTRTLDAFRSGALKVLIATDVAARGLDVAEVGRVIHFDVPDNDEVYTHRSGRTGRAGRKGTSHVLVPPSRHRLVAEMVRRARGHLNWQPVPGPEDVYEAEAERLEARVLEEGPPADPRLVGLAEQLLDRADPVELVTRLLALADQNTPTRPRRIAAVDAPSANRSAPGPGRRTFGTNGAVTFRVGWGTRQGADPRRLLALVCRRGKVNGSDIGAIYVGPTSSTVEVAGSVADQFAAAVRTPDARDGHVRIAPLGQSGPGAEPPRSTRHARPDEGPPAQHQGKRPFGRPTAAPRWASPR